MISIQINDQQQELQSSKPIQSVLEELGLFREGIAVALNETVIPKREWNEQMVKDGDRMMIVRAVQGG